MEIPHKLWLKEQKLSSAIKILYFGSCLSLPNMTILIYKICQASTCFMSVLMQMAIHGPCILLHVSTFIKEIMVIFVIAFHFDSIDGLRCPLLSPIFCEI